MSLSCSHSLSLPILEMITVSDDEFARLSKDLGIEASFCCPNCDGSITYGEHRHTNLCSECNSMDSAETYRVYSGYYS